MSFEVRPIVPEEFGAYVAADAAAFGWDANPEHLAEIEQIFEFDRTLAAFDGEEIVGTASMVRAGRPGFYTRSEKWWQHMILRGPDAERRMGTRFYVQYEEDGRVLGYARYRVRGDSRDGLPNGTLTVQELTA